MFALKATGTRLKATLSGKLCAHFAVMGSMVKQCGQV